MLKGTLRDEMDSLAHDDVSGQLFWMDKGARLVLSRLRRHWKECVDQKWDRGVAELEAITDRLEQELNAYD